MVQKAINNQVQWFAVYTQSRAEKKVYERLVNLGFEVFLPLVTTVKHWSDRKKKVTEPLIKSFVFVKTSNKKFSEIVSTPGVLSILKYLGKPAVVREVEIENLKLVINNSEFIKTIKPIDLSNGEAVEVIKGPFKGLIAKFISRAGKYRIVIEIEALKNFIEVNIPLNTIKKVKL